MLSGQLCRCTGYTAIVDAIAEVARSRKHIAVIAASSSDRWWEALAPSGAPKVFAKLPFIETPDRPGNEDFPWPAPILCCPPR